MPPHAPQHSNQYHNNRHTYIPEHAQRIMAQRMERSVPASMKRYVEPYMQQNVVQPSMGGQAFSQQLAQSLNPRPNAVPNFQQQNHFEQLGGQQPGQSVSPTPVNPTPPSQAAPQPAPAAAPQPQTPQPVAAAEPYDFIMNAGQAPNRSLPLPQLNSTPKRAIFAVGGLIVLIILITIVKGLFSSTPDLTSFVGIAQDQQELIHLTSPASGNGQPPVLSTATQNFVATSNASLASSQTAIITYLANNGQKVKVKQLSLKVSQQLDTQLTNAQAAGTYEQTFQQIMQAQLTAYKNDLSQVYNKTKGQKGRVLLSSDYNQAKLLLTQLGNGQ